MNYNLCAIKTSFYFSDHINFKPNLSPREIFLLGSFGGTYWRSIFSNITHSKYNNIHLNYPKSWWKDIPDHFLISNWEQYDKNINKYKVKVGLTLEEWEQKGWITKLHPYGWIQWYCDFFLGKRCKDDQRQIMRWTRLAGDRGRFRMLLIRIIIKNNGVWNDDTIGKKIRQTLQHWGYKLTYQDFINGKNIIKSRQ